MGGRIFLYARRQELTGGGFVEPIRGEGLKPGARSALKRHDFEGPLVEGELMLGEAFPSIDTMQWQP